MSNSDLEMFILDALVDCESLPLLIELLNNDDVGYKEEYGGTISEPELLVALRRLLEQQLVAALSERSDLGALVPLGCDSTVVGKPDIWYERTLKGEQALRQWDPPLTVAQIALLKDVVERRRPELLHALHGNRVDRRHLRELADVVRDEMLTEGLTQGPRGAELSKYGEVVDDLWGRLSFEEYDDVDSRE